ncbi:DNA-binding transcriptional MerR regulator [Natranaerovirga hydrolytica]|uniref:DNA-binding transcriptional MerR regulator n=1 Tax=Natranaerovirga hydrolytica TaxID=680378 RepID=A0A4R1MYG1_9FIRM|nr:MerR family transcriptional regulator [Natranaerovirga hydrolytica]TCK98175.1 DNA-binding transcriptional MerR regulator [Natranaerovirga hydrolytica]
MYTIGQISTLLGISKDKLRYYEEKGILSPIQDENNNYRQYDFKDIDTILTIEYYRSLDIGFKTIKSLYEQSSIQELKSVLNKKQDTLSKEISRLNATMDQIEETIEACEKVEKYCNKFLIKPMNPIKVLGEISDFRAYNEFELIHKNSNRIKKNALVKSFKRYITFNDSGIESSKFYITTEPENEDTIDDNVLEFQKCLYTIVEDDNRYSQNNVEEKTFENVQECLSANQYKHKGIAIVSILLIQFYEDDSKTYLEIFIPIE